VSLASALAAVAPIREGEVLARHTTIGIGGPADLYVTPETTAQLIEVLRLSHDQGASVFMLGSGSNIVIGDRGMRGVTIESKAQALTEPHAFRSTNDDPLAAGFNPQSPLPPQPSSAERFLFRADGGCSFAAVSRQLSFAGFKGLEWACGIPGTIGGAVVYNAGAYGGCLGDVLLRVGVWSAEDGEHVYEASELGLVYRASDFTRGLMTGKAVLWAEFALWPGDATELRARVADYDGRRLKAQPRGRNAGSFFKNPPDHPAWKLIDSVGMRGYQIGGAQFSEKHCNFLINAGGATAADVAALKAEAQRRVREQFGVELENEVTLVGEGFGN
jgi:UDP-N-acetylmuramate dehydrogenase